MANDINVTIGADIRSITESLDKIEQQSKKTASSVTSAFGGVSSVLVSAFSFDKVMEAMQFVVEFDDGLRQAQSAANLTAEQFEKLKQKALELGREPGQTPALIATGMAEAAKAGQNFDQIMQSVAATANLAAATELDFAQATEMGVNIMSQYGLAVDQTARVVDVLVAGANASTVSVTDIGESMKFAGSISNSLGVSLEETAAQLMVLAQNSIKGEMGGTALRGIWAQLIEKSDQLKDSFGVQISTIQNGQTVYRSLADIFDSLKQAGIQTSEVFDIFGNVAGPAASIFLKQGGDAIRDYQEQLENAGGTGQKVAETLQSGIGGAMRTITSAGQSAVLMFGDELAPAFQFVADNSNILIASFDALIGVIRTVRSAHAEFLATFVGGLSSLAEYTDMVGLTEDASASLATVQKDLKYVADEAGQSGAEMFSKAYDEITKATDKTKEHTETVKKSGEAVKQVDNDYQQFGDNASSAVEKVSKTEKEAVEERERNLKELYSGISKHSDAYFVSEISKIEQNVEKWRSLGFEEVDIQQKAFDAITALSQTAFEEGNSQSSEYLNSLKSEYTLAVSSISDENQKLIEEYEKLTGIELYVDDRTDWEAIKKDVEDIKKGVDSTNDNPVDVPDETDLSSSVYEVENLSENVDSLNGTELEISADTSSVENATGTLSVATNSVESLRDAIQMLNETPTLDPFGTIRDGYQNMISEIQNVDNVAAEIQSALSGIDDPFGEMASKYQDKIDQIKGVEKTAADEIATIRDEAFQEINEKRIKQEEEYQKERIRLEKEALEQEKEGYEDQRDMIKDQLDSAKQALEDAKEQQSLYWEDQLESAQNYYDELEAERDAVFEKYQEQAEEEYSIALNNYEKKLQLIKDEQSLRNEQLSYLKEIYEESGAAGEEYYKAEADALAEKAQEMADSGISSLFVEKWLQDQLGELRDQAAEEGIKGISSYTNSVINSYRETGNFSNSLVQTNQEMSSLTSKIEALKEAGAEAFFNNAEYAAYNFDNRLIDAQNNVTGIQSQIDLINGDTFDAAGRTADDFASAVENATNNVYSLENSLAGVEDQLDAIERKKKALDVSGSSSKSESGSKSGSSSKSESGSKSGNWFNDAWSSSFGSATFMKGFAGGGYTGDDPRSGGLDGQGGFMAILHPQETVIDHTVSNRNSSVDNSSQMLLNKLDQLISKVQNETTVYVGNINVEKKMTVDELDKLAADLKRREKRG